MADFFGKLVVRGYASPKRRAWFLGTAATLAALLLYGVFELGRYDAGYRVIDSVRGAWAASSRVRRLEAENARLQSDLAASDVGRRIDRESYKQVQRSVGDMQSQIARLTQDLSFYRGLVQPDSLVHVKVQQMQIVPETAGRFNLKFVLMQTGKPDNTVAGTLAIVIDGLLAGKPQSLKLADVSVDRRGGLAYSFRYFQDYDEVVQLPPAFEPTRIDVELFAARDSTHGFRQAFVWKAQGMSVETEANGEGSKEKSDVQTESE
ncbi:MAG: DUF6776 family protein [Steroidobacteraceae bacterium]|jgi:hypothetical protein